MASTGPTPVSGTNGLFDIFVDNMVDADTAALFDINGNYLADFGAGISSINLANYGPLVDGIYHVLFYALSPACTTSYAVCVLIPQLARDGTYTLSGHIEGRPKTSSTLMGVGS